MRKTFLGAAALLCAIATAHAQTGPWPSDCRAMKDDKARLACYDTLMASTWPDKPIWEGTGNKQIPPFNTNSDWTLHWSTTDDDGLTIFVYTDPSTQQYVDEPSSNAAGTDESYETATGPIYLRIIGSGSWKIWITPGGS